MVIKRIHAPTVVFFHGRFLKACGYSVSTLASSSFSTFNNQKKVNDKMGQTLPLTTCLSQQSTCDCHLAASHSCTYSSPFQSDTSSEVQSSNNSRIISSSTMKSVPSVETDHSNDVCSVWVSGLCGHSHGQLATLGPGQVLPTSVCFYASRDIISYCVIGDLILGFKINASIPSLNVSVGQCTRIWDRLLTLHHQREWYVKLYLRSGNDATKVKKDKTSVQKCCCDPVFNEAFDYKTDCKSGYLEASLWMSKGLLSSNEALGMALISLGQLPIHQNPEEELRSEYKLLVERRIGE